MLPDYDNSSPKINTPLVHNTPTNHFRLLPLSVAANDAPAPDENGLPFPPCVARPASSVLLAALTACVAVAVVVIDSVVELLVVELEVVVETALPPLIDILVTVLILPVDVLTLTLPLRPLDDTALSGTATTYIVPALAMVEVMVVAPVSVGVAARAPAMLFALATTAGAIGTPYAAQVSATG